MPITETIDTPFASMEHESVPMADGWTVYKGQMVCVNAAGHAVDPEDAGAARRSGVATETVTADTGVDGEVSVPIRRYQLAAFKNSAVNPVTQADVGATAYVEDGETVANAGTIFFGTISSIDAKTGKIWILLV